MGEGTLKDLSYKIEFESTGLEAILDAEKQIDAQVENVLKTTVEADNANKKIINGIDKIQRYSTEVGTTWKKIDGKFVKVSDTAQKIKIPMDKIQQYSGKIDGTWKKIDGKFIKVNKDVNKVASGTDKIQDTIANTDTEMQHFNNTSTKSINIFKKLASGIGNAFKATKNGVSNTIKSTREGHTKFKDSFGKFKKERTERKGGASPLDGLGQKVAGVFATKAIVDFGKSAFDTYANWEQSMANVHATLGQISDEDYKKLAQASRKAGAETVFSAQEAADAENYLALSGMKVDEIVTAMPKVLNLASAGSMDLARAADLATDGLSACGLQVKDLDGFMDKMAKTSQKTNTNIEQIGQGIITVGGVAKDANMSIADMDTALGILANSGKKGAEGGTALRNVLLNLTANDKAVKLMHEMGVKTADASGKIRPLNNILVDLKGALGKETQANQQFIKGVIGGKENIQALNILLEGSGEQYENLKKQILDSNGAAQEMADIQKNTVRGALKEVESAMSEVKLSMFDGEQGTGALRDGLQQLAEKLLENKDKFAELGAKIVDVFNWVLDNSGAIITAFQVILEAILAYKAIKAIIDLVTLWRDAQLLLNIALTDNPIGLVITIVGLLVLALIEVCRHSEAVRDAFGRMWQGMRNGAEAAINWIVEKLNKVIDLFNRVTGLSVGHANEVHFTKETGQASKQGGMALPKKSSNGIKMSVTDDWLAPRKKMATGGITMPGKPVWAEIGEGKEQEAVIPLSKLQDFVNVQQQPTQNTQPIQVNIVIQDARNPAQTASLVGQKVKEVIEDMCNTTHAQLYGVQPSV